MATMPTMATKVRRVNQIERGGFASDSYHGGAPLRGASGTSHATRTRAVESATKMPPLGRQHRVPI